MRSPRRSSSEAPPRPHGAFALILPRGLGHWGFRFLPSIVSELGHESVSWLACPGGGFRTYLRLGPLPEAPDRKLSDVCGVRWRKCCRLHRWRREKTVGRLDWQFGLAGVRGPFPQQHHGLVLQPRSRRGCPGGFFRLLDAAPRSTYLGFAWASSQRTGSRLQLCGPQ